ncbi:MAG: TatD family hydrolase [Bacteroidetes bacterium]|nr:TatD family hydrolase [Bacteroidota bacterium]
MEFIDSHSHIYLKDFQEDIEQVLDRCLDKKVEKILMPNIDAESIEDMLKLEQQYPQICYSMMGVHPCSVDEKFEHQLSLAESWLEKRKFVAIGETGIDLYWNDAFKAQQIESLDVQIAWAKKYNIPIVLHCRNSFNETIEVIEGAQDGTLRGVFHCFTGTLEEAIRVTEAGFHLGLGGVVTFKNGGLDQVVPQLDLGDILLETDSPYLAPVPYRGKRNESSYVTIIGQKVAEFMNVELEEIAKATHANASKLFSLKE